MTLFDWGNGYTILNLNSCVPPKGWQGVMFVKKSNCIVREFTEVSESDLSRNWGESFQRLMQMSSWAYHPVPSQSAYGIKLDHIYKTLK